MGEQGCRIQQKKHVYINKMDGPRARLALSASDGDNVAAARHSTHAACTAFQR
jgi:hypothetical protein